MRHFPFALALRHPCEPSSHGWAAAVGDAEGEEDLGATLGAVDGEDDGFALAVGDVDGARLGSVVMRVHVAGSSSSSREGTRRAF